jgi:hypothetical protein
MHKAGYEMQTREGLAGIFQDGDFHLHKNVMLCITLVKEKVEVKV